MARRTLRQMRNGRGSVQALDLIPEVSRRLQRRYRSASLGNKANPLDELIYIQLTVRTREGAYQDRVWYNVQ